MFERKNMLVLVMVVLTLTNLAILAMILINRPDQTSHGFKPPPSFSKDDTCMQEPGKHWQTELGFTPAQAEKMKQLKDEFRASFDKLMEASRDKQDKIFDELAKENPDTIKLDKLAIETGELHTMMRRESIRHIMQIKAMTTPEQHQRMLNFMRQSLPGNIGPGPHAKPGKPGRFKEPPDQKNPKRF